MAKRTVNKSELVRKAVKENPSASNQEIAELLKANDISAQYVSTIKSKMTGPSKNKEITADELIKASELISELGGVARVREMLEKIEKISQAN